MEFSLNEIMMNEMKKYTTYMLEKAVKVLSKEYGFSEEEALDKMRIKEIKVEVDKKVEKKEKKAAPKIPFPFTGEIQEEWCGALKHNYGLYSQCTNSKWGENELCKTCKNQEDKKGQPTFGYISDRLKCELMEYKDGKGKKVMTYGMVLKKLDISRAFAEEEAKKFGLTIPDEQFKISEKTLGRPKSVKAEETADKKRGRPKIEKKMTSANAADDLIATLVAQAQQLKIASSSLSLTETETASSLTETETASSLTETETASSLTETETASSELEEEEEEEDEEAKALAEQEKEKAKALVEQEKAAKKALAEEEKAAKKALAEEEKAAKKALAEEEKAAKKALADQEKAAKKALAEAEKAAKKALAEEEKAEKAAQKALADQDKADKKAQQEKKEQKAQEEEKAKAKEVVPAKAKEVVPAKEEEESISVKKFEFNGKIYLRSADNVMYDSESQEPIGMWNEEEECIDEIEMEDEEEEED